MSLVQRLSCGMRDPTPVPYLRQILAVLADVKLVTFHRAPVTVCRCLLLLLKPWYPADDVECQLVAVQVVQHDHVEGRRRRPLIPKPTHVKIVMVMPPISQPVDHSRIAVERKDHWLVAREHCIE